MKKKLSLILVVITFISLISSLIVYASVKETISTEKIFSDNDKILIEESFVEIENKKIKNKRTIDEVSQLLENYLQTYNLDGNTNNCKIKYIKNNLDSREEIVIESDGNILTLNGDTNDLISYVNKKKNFPKNQLSEEETKNIAKILFEKTNICNINEYKLIFFEKFDDEIWMAGFAKKYDNLVNIGEQVKFSFAPQSKEILTLAINDIKYDNNEVNISESVARKIANDYLSITNSTDIKIYLDIVRPNAFFATDLNENEVYIKKQNMRKAYVCELNNKAQTKIYIDCETGQVLGGTMNLGGKL